MKLAAASHIRERKSPENPLPLSAPPGNWGVPPAAAVYQFIPTGDAATDNSAQT
ncbi:MAG: hypothetical protein KME26_24645 [Oscillatoria princeps RMCB-10]|nr:hypothetical protein [Oscillatoria princeps RMCB-10]